LQHSPKVANWFLVASVVCEVVATLGLKSIGKLPWLALFVALGYAGAFYFLALTLRFGKPIGVAYGIWGALGVVFAALGAWIVYDEHLTIQMVLGFLCISVGVLLLEANADVLRVYRRFRNRISRRKPWENESDSA
jgi:small multidrug resistance pump